MFGITEDDVKSQTLQLFTNKTSIFITLKELLKPKPQRSVQERRERSKNYFTFKLLIKLTWAPPRTYISSSRSAASRQNIVATRSRFEAKTRSYRPSTFVACRLRFTATGVSNNQKNVAQKLSQKVKSRRSKLQVFGDLTWLANYLADVIRHRWIAKLYWWLNRGSRARRLKKKNSSEKLKKNHRSGYFTKSITICRSLSFIFR